MSFLTLEEKRYSFKVKSYSEKEKDSDCASVWSESTVDGLRPTRLYQSVLLLAGFMTTFQTIGMNQSYGVFQVSPPLNPHNNSSPKLQYI